MEELINRDKHNHSRKIAKRLLLRGNKNYAEIAEDCELSLEEVMELAGEKTA